MLVGPLLPEVFPRLVLCALAALGAVLAGSATGYGLGRAAAESGADAAFSLTMAGMTLVLAVVCAIPVVALWRSTQRIQRGWQHDPLARARQ